MKRLVMVFVAVVTTAVFAQGRDFSGTWVLDVEKSGKKQGPPGLTVKLTTKEFAVTFGSGERADTLTFKLDGTETDLGHDGKGRAEWRGDKLLATITFGRGPQTAAFYREGTWLVQEEQGGPKPEKWYFKKASAK